MTVIRPHNYWNKWWEVSGFQEEFQDVYVDYFPTEEEARKQAEKLKLANFECVEVNAPSHTM